MLLINCVRQNLPSTEFVKEELFMYLIFVYVPESHVTTVKEAMFSAGAGKMGNYSRCSWQVAGEGQFCPEVGSNAYIGQIGSVEKVNEFKVETFCANADDVDRVIAAMKQAHPYEVPAFGVIELSSVIPK